MITLVKHHITEAGESRATTESHDDMNRATKAFYQYLSNYAADTTVIRADVVLLNGSLIPCKQEHFVREMPVEQAENAEE